MRARLIIAIGCAALGCGGREQPDGSPAAAPDDPRARQIVTAEGEREAGVDRLVALAGRDVPREIRALAVRGLGRVGNAAAIRALEAIVASAGEPAAPDAVLALGLVGTELDEAALIAVDRSRLAADGRRAVAHAFGRAGTERSLDALAALLGDPDRRVAVEAALSLGVFGRRKISLSPGLRTKLAALCADRDPTLRYAAGYALAREHAPPADAAPAAVAALLPLASDGDPETRALAVFGLAQRHHVGSPVYRSALGDADWRVQVQAVRALAADWQSEAERADLAAWLAARWKAMTPAERGGPGAHAIVEGVTLLLPSAKVSGVRDAARAIYDAGGDREIRCRAAAIVDRATGAGLVDMCLAGQPGPWPAREHNRLFVEVRGTTVSQAMAKYYLSDPPERAALLEALAALDQFDEGLVTDAIQDEASVVAGTAADLTAQRLSAGKSVPPKVVDAALARAKAETDPELAASVLAVLAAAKLPAALPVCRTALSHSLRPIRAKARDCLKALTGRDPGRGEAGRPMDRPPVDPLRLLGKRVTWTVRTSRGELVIELDPARAPWHVAVVAELTDKRFYDRLIFHRVVPDFVVQGGDPSGSGWGGPGFTVPAEPAPVPCTRGMVGIADAGLDTGGSQWFVMHSRAAHLESRYTLIGELVRGQEVADSLRVGDRIESATVEVR